MKCDIIYVNYYFKIKITNIIYFNNTKHFCFLFFKIKNKTVCSFKTIGLKTLEKLDLAQLVKSSNRFKKERMCGVRVLMIINLLKNN